MSVDMVLLELHPAVPHSWWWWLVAAGLLLVGLGIAALGIVRWRTLRTEPVQVADDSFHDLRRSTLADIDSVLTRADLDAPTRARLIGRAVRRFAGIALDADADYQTTDQLRVAALKDPRLVPVARLSARVDPLAWSGASTVQVEELAGHAREVVRTWR